MDLKTLFPVSQRWRLALMGLAALYAAAVLTVRTVSVGGQETTVLFDDAMISMRYALHLAQGHGLVWNLGEAPVEGFTNPLWVLWMALWHWLGFSGAEVCRVILASSLASLLGTVWLLASWNDGEEENKTGLMAATALLGTYAILYWCGTGLEVGFLMLLFTLAFVLLSAPHPRLGWACAMLTMALWVRMDSAVMAAALLAVAWSQSPPGKSWKALLGAIVCAVLGLLLPTLWRHAYFGEWVPNTYFLKVDGALCGGAWLGVPRLTEISYGLSCLL